MKEDPKNDPKRDRKMFSPSQAAQQNLKVFHHPKFAQKSFFCFTAMLCRGSHAKKFAPPPPKIPPDDEEGLLWGWCVVGGALRKTQEGCGGLGGEIQQRSRRRGRFSRSHFLGRKVHKPSQG